MVVKKDGASCGQYPDKGLEMRLENEPATVSGLANGTLKTLVFPLVRGLMVLSAKFPPKNPIH